MRTWLTLSLMLLLVVAGRARSQEPDAVPPEPRAEDPTSLAPAPVASPSAQYYRRPTARDPHAKTAAQRRAEFCATERMLRLQSMKWYGLSNSRPIVSPTPVYGTYAPLWVSGGVDPSRWGDYDSSQTTVANRRVRYLFW